MRSKELLLEQKTPTLWHTSIWDIANIDFAYKGSTFAGMLGQPQLGLDRRRTFACHADILSSTSKVISTALGLNEVIQKGACCVLAYSKKPGSVKHYWV